MRNEDYFGFDYATSGARVPFYGLVEPTMRLADTIAAGVLAVYRALERAAAAVRRRRMIEHTVAELARLDDHMLADIGIQRHQIPTVAQAVTDNPWFSVRDLPR